VDTELGTALFNVRDQIGLEDSSQEEIRETVAAMAAKERDALRAIPVVAEELLRMKRAKVTESDSSAALAKFAKK
jgi:hypothetical protein